MAVGAKLEVEAEVVVEVEVEEPEVEVEVEVEVELEPESEKSGVRLEAGAADGPKCAPGSARPGARVGCPGPRGLDGACWGAPHCNGAAGVPAGLHGAGVTILQP